MRPGIHNKNYTERKQKFDWKRRMSMTKFFSQFLFERLDKSFSHQISYEVLDYPPRLIVKLICDPKDTEVTVTLHQQILDYCKKWGFVWKVWRTDTPDETKVLYQLTYTFEEYKEPKYEPYTEPKENY